LSNIFSRLTLMQCCRSCI